MLITPDDFLNEKFDENPPVFSHPRIESKQKALLALNPLIRFGDRFTLMNLVLETVLGQKPGDETGSVLIFCSSKHNCEQVST